MQITGKDTGRFKLPNARAPCAFSTATHATSCSTFRAAKNLDPYLLKVDSVISIAFIRTLAPMYPTKNSNIPPNICPSTTGSHNEDKVEAFPIPIPASISETEIATPNQITAFVKSPVRFSIVAPNIRF